VFRRSSGPKEVEFGEIKGRVNVYIRTEVRDGILAGPPYKEALKDSTGRVWDKVLDQDRQVLSGVGNSLFYYRMTEGIEESRCRTYPACRRI
jgi:hypothetical protein